MTELVEKEINQIVETVPIQFIKEILLSQRRTKHLSSLDLRWGYHQMASDGESIHKTAFITTKGKYKFLKEPFGLVQVPARFQVMMNRVLQNYHL